MNDFSIAKLLFILGSIHRLERLMLFQHMIKDARNFVRRRHNGLFGAHTRFHPAVKHTWGIVAPTYRLRRQPKSLPRSIVVLERPTAQDLATRNVIVGAKPSQEQKCFSLGQAVMSVPISDTMVCTVSVLRPEIATKSTPVT